MGLKLRKRGHELKREDGELVGRTSPATELQVVSASGSHVTDARGRTFVDFQMGWCVGNLGWNHPEIVARLQHFDGPSYVPPAMLYAPWVELARSLAEVAPGKLTRTYRVVGGTEAVECALQLAMAYTGRTRLVSIEGAYHGNSFGAVSIGEPARLASKLTGCKHLAPPLDAKALGRLETLLAHRDVAAVILEPIIMNLGVEIPEPGFLAGARELCDAHGTLLIFDEVACGFGRTGALFASEHAGVVPDIMTLGKAMASGHAPIAATITTAEIADAVREDFHFYSTYGWHPLGVEAALATLAYWTRHRAALLDNIAERSAEFTSRLLAMPWRHDPELRLMGLAIAMRFEQTGYTSALAERCLEAGLLIGDEEHDLVMFPALTIDRDTAHAGLDILERVVEGMQP